MVLKNAEAKSLSFDLSPLVVVAVESVVVVAVVVVDLLS